MLLIFSPHHPEGCLSPPFSWTRASKIWTTQYRKQYTKQRIIIDKSCLQQNVFLKTMEESWWIRYDVFKTRNFFFFFFLDGRIEIFLRKTCQVSNIIKLSSSLWLWNLQSMLMQTVVTRKTLLFFHFALFPSLPNHWLLLTFPSN